MRRATSLLFALLALAACAHQGAPAPPVPTLGPQPSPTLSPSPAPTPSAPGPLYRLWLGEHQPDVDYLTAVLDASEAWERAVGRPLFSWSEGRPVQLMQFPRIDAGPVAPGTATGAITFRAAGLVIFSAQTPATARPTTVLHELGHVLGLHHSPDPASIMFERSTTQTITPQDAAAAIAALGKEAP